MKLKKSFRDSQKAFGWAPLLLVGLLVLSFAIRYPLLGFLSGDYIYFLGPWYDFIEKNGGFLALKESFSDYNMPYLYLLTIATYLPLEKIVSIKAISFVFEYALAGVAFLAILKTTSSRPKALFAFFAILFLPTVLFNGPLWGQSDAIFTTFAVASIVALMTKRPRAACILFGVSLAFKLQAVFIAPVFLLFFLRKEITFRNLLWIPATFMIALAPAIAIGKPIKEALLIYIKQVGAYESLTLNAPNFYQWLPNSYFELFNTAGLIFAVAITLGAVVLFYTRKNNFALNFQEALLLATFFALLVPFVLPQMHERYFFPADILALLLAITKPRLWPIPTLIITASFFSYFPFLFQTAPISLQILPFALIAALVILLREIFLPDQTTRGKKTQS